jgi:hypothetical protein
VHAAHEPLLLEGEQVAAHGLDRDVESVRQVGGLDERVRADLLEDGEPAFLRYLCSHCLPLGLLTVSEESWGK